MSLADRMKTPHEGKVAILGFADSWKLAPFDDPSMDVWGLNELHKYVPRWNRWWEVHDDDTLGVTKRDASDAEQKRHLEWLSKDYGPDRPIYMRPEFVVSGRFPNAAAYPLEQMCEIFGRYFTSTIGYMTALAIYEGYSWIGLYGIDLASDIEYQSQRANTEYLVGIAQGLGREVVIPPTSALLKAGHLYGYEKALGEQSKILSAVKAHEVTLRKKHEETLALLNTLDGAIQESQNFVKLHEYNERGVHLATY